MRRDKNDDRGSLPLFLLCPTVSILWLKVMQPLTKTLNYDKNIFYDVIFQEECYEYRYKTK